MASWPKLPELPQPNDRPTVERTFRGFQAALEQMTPAQLIDLSVQQAALLEEQRIRVTSELLSGWSRSQLDSPVQRSEPMELPSRSPTAPAGVPSPFQPPFPQRRRSRSAAIGRAAAAKLAGADSRRSPR